MSSFMIFKTRRPCHKYLERTCDAEYLREGLSTAFLILNSPIPFVTIGDGVLGVSSLSSSSVYCKGRLNLTSLRVLSDDLGDIVESRGVRVSESREGVSFLFIGGQRALVLNDLELLKRPKR